MDRSLFLLDLVIGHHYSDLLEEELLHGLHKLHDPECQFSNGNYHGRFIPSIMMGFLGMMEVLVLFDFFDFVSDTLLNLFL